MEKINKISKHFHHLLSHLEGEELIVFLDGSDKGRESILKVRPPSIDQRRACVWSSPDKLSTKFENILKESVSPWDGPKILKSDSQRIVKKMRG